jgi:hypothetical protein
MALWLTTGLGGFLSQNRGALSEARYRAGGFEEWRENAVWLAE